MEQEYTKGPWVIDQELNEYLHISKEGEVEVIATLQCEPLQPETFADARLIAASPDLLEALIDYTSNQNGNYDAKSCGHNFFCICPQQKAKDAIAKALGVYV